MRLGDRGEGHIMSSPSRRAGALPAPMLYSIRETERLLGVSRPTIYRLIAAGRLVALKIGNATRIPASEIDRLLAEAIRLGGGAQ
jgi:excisionase family DNA binding protein